jgi:hypothetical protein
MQCPETTTSPPELNSSSNLTPVKDEKFLNAPARLVLLVYRFFLIHQVNLLSPVPQVYGTDELYLFSSSPDEETSYIFRDG